MIVVTWMAPRKGQHRPTQNNTKEILVIEQVKRGTKMPLDMMEIWEAGFHMMCFVAILYIVQCQIFQVKVTRKSDLLLALNRAQACTGYCQDIIACLGHKK